MPTPPKPSTVLAELSQVATQVNDAKNVDKDTLSKARALRAASKFVTDHSEMLTKLGATGTDEVTAKLDEWAGIVAPQASTQWDEADVATKLNLMESYSGLNLLSDEEKATLSEISETLKSVRKGTGQRAARKPQEVIEGRPERIIVTKGDVKVANQAGNIPNTVSNVKTRAVAFINGLLPDSEVTEDQANEIAEAIRQVVEQGNTEAKALGLTFSAGESDPEE